jgi:hypothetical protein
MSLYGRGRIIKVIRRRIIIRATKKDIWQYQGINSELFSKIVSAAERLHSFAVLRRDKRLPGI